MNVSRRYRNRSFKDTVPGTSEAGAPFSYGGILFADVIGFSKRNEDQQIACVHRMSLWVEQDEWLQTLDARHVYKNGTGDGFVIVVDSHAGPVVAHLLQVAERIRRALRTLLVQGDAGDEPQLEPFRLRLGIHFGRFSLGRHAFGGIHAVGTGINMAQRVMSWSENEEIAVSEIALQELRGAHGPSAFLFYPPLEGDSDSQPGAGGHSTDPIEVGIKHGKTLLFRFLVDPEKRLEDWRPNRRLRELERWHSAVEGLVEDIAQVVWASVQSPARVMLFVPRECNTGFASAEQWELRRVVLVEVSEVESDDGGRMAEMGGAPQVTIGVQEGGTRHRLGNPSCRGPVVRAFEDGREVLIRDLPVGMVKRKYIDAFRAKDPSISKAALESWQTRPTTLLEIPIFAHPHDTTESVERTPRG